MVKLLELQKFLWEGDDVFAKERLASTRTATPPKVARVDLRVVQRDEHGLQHGGMFEIVEEVLAETNVVGEAHEGVHAIARGEGRHALQHRVIFNLLQVSLARGADASVASGAHGVGGGRRAIPRSYGHWASRCRLERERWHVFRVEGGKARAAHVAVE